MSWRRQGIRCRETLVAPTVGLTLGDLRCWPIQQLSARPHGARPPRRRRRRIWRPRALRSPARSLAWDGRRRRRSLRETAAGGGAPWRRQRWRLRGHGEGSGEVRASAGEERVRRIGST
uniref:Uncharacterized protein n=1 Tax=Arundo donax TaxID=35708 RepID=A0A0A9D4W8_ARUDO